MVLTKTETAILANAARRETLALLPLPRFIFVRGLSLIIALEKLIRLGLVAERQAAPDEPVWRSERTPTTLTLTGPGLAALGGAPTPASGDIPQTSFPEDVRRSVLMSIMSRPHGADVKLIQHETSLPLHCVREAISGLRAEGYVFDHVRDGHDAATYQLLGWLPGDDGLEPTPAGGILHA